MTLVEGAVQPLVDKSNLARAGQVQNFAVIDAADTPAAPQSGTAGSL